MTDVMERHGTQLPTHEDAELAALASRALARTAVESLTVRLDDGEELQLPTYVTRLLARILSETGRGNAVTIMPLHAMLTTQEAAEFLGVSRPFLVRVLERGDLPFTMVGTHRRVKFLDLADYKASFERRSGDALDALAEQAQDLSLGY